MKQREAVLFAMEKRRWAEAGERIVRFYEATGRPEKARAWREKLNLKQPEPVTGLVKPPTENGVPPTEKGRRP